MIEIEINGNRRSLDPRSVDELRGYIDGALPASEVICLLRVNGDDAEREDLGTRDLASIRNLEIRTAQPETLARGAVPETIEWIGRVGELLSSIGQDFRYGREREATARLISAADALQVMSGLLSAIRQFAVSDPLTGGQLENEWKTSESELRLAVDALVSDLENGDPVRLADLLSHRLPRILEQFAALLESISR
jgi:hypothetical protein